MRSTLLIHRLHIETPVRLKKWPQKSAKNTKNQQDRSLLFLHLLAAILTIFNRRIYRRI